MQPRPPAQHPGSHAGSEDAAAVEHHDAGDMHAAPSGHKPTSRQAEPGDKAAPEPESGPGRPFRQRRPEDRPNLARLLQGPAAHHHHQAPEAPQDEGSRQQRLPSASSHKDAAGQDDGPRHQAEREGSGEALAGKLQVRGQKGPSAVGRQDRQAGLLEPQHHARHAQAARNAAAEADEHKNSEPPSPAGQYQQPAFVQRMERSLIRSGTLRTSNDREAPQGSRRAGGAGSAQSENNSHASNRGGLQESWGGHAAKPHGQGRRSDSQHAELGTAQLGHKGSNMPDSGGEVRCSG